LIQTSSQLDKAIVAIARKLLVVVWHVLTECVADRKAAIDWADPQQRLSQLQVLARLWQIKGASAPHSTNLT
jgi:hypothetical protein